METELTRVLEAEREAAGLSWLEFEEELGIRRNYLTDLRTGRLVAMGHREVKRLARWLGWTVTAVEQLNKAHRMMVGKRVGCEAQVVDVRGWTFPARTLIGRLFQVPVVGKGQSCEDCPFLERCAGAVRAGDYLLCEQVLDRELLPGVSYSEGVQTPGVGEAAGGARLGS